MAVKANRVKQALERIAAGESVRKACELAEIAMTSFLRNVDADQYARARDAQADHHFNEMAELEERCLNGGMDPHAYRAAMDTRKWRLARMKPAVYGDKLGVDLGGGLEINITIQGFED
jgi:hypothetical protein